MNVPAGFTTGFSFYYACQVGSLAAEWLTFLMAPTLPAPCSTSVALGKVRPRESLHCLGTVWGSLQRDWPCR